MAKRRTSAKTKRKFVDDLSIEWWEIERVKPYDSNPRDNDAAVDAVAASIRQFGFRKPLVVDSDGVLICGHTCRRAAEKLGKKRVPVHVAKSLTPDEVRAYRIADNKTAELAEWDSALLRIELEELREAEFPVDELGFDASELETLLGVGGGGDAKGLTDPDDIPAPPDKATTKRGDIWVLGDHRLMCGDGSVLADVERLMGGAVAHMVNTDPPYNVKVEPRTSNAITASRNDPGTYGSATHHQQLDRMRRANVKSTTEKMRPRDRRLANDFKSDAEFDKLLSAWFANCARALIPGGAFYVWGGYANCVNYPPALKAAGLYFSQSIIWVKNHPNLVRKDFLHNHEWCFYGWREGAAHKFYGAVNNQDVWYVAPFKSPGGENGLAVALEGGLRIESGGGQRIDVGAPKGQARRIVKLESDAGVVIDAGTPTDLWIVRKITPQQMIHLTEKPVELAERAIVLSSRPGEHVLDIFGGSGSTLIAAEQAGRKSFLMEIDPVYCDVIVERWEKFTGKRAKRLKGNAAASSSSGSPTPRKSKRK